MEYNDSVLSNTAEVNQEYYLNLCIPTNQIRNERRREEVSPISTAAQSTMVQQQTQFIQPILQALPVQNMYPLSEYANSHIFPAQENAMWTQNGASPGELPRWSPLFCEPQPEHFSSSHIPSALATAEKEYVTNIAGCPPNFIASKPARKQNLPVKEKKSVLEELALLYAQSIVQSTVQPMTPQITAEPVTKAPMKPLLPKSNCPPPRVVIPQKPMAHQLKALAEEERKRKERQKGKITPQNHSNFPGRCTLNPEIPKLALLKSLELKENKRNNEESPKSELENREEQAISTNSRFTDLFNNWDSDCGNNQLDQSRPTSSLSQISVPSIMRDLSFSPFDETMIGGPFEEEVEQPDPYGQ